MADKKPLGTILLESGRITQADVERVLEHQRAHGGFFGQALIELDIVTRDEIDWALASQFDLPFIFPNPETVDPEAAMLVPAEWALAHLAVPMVKSGNSVTVVVADPLRGEVLEDLRRRTGLEVEMALASGARIRELIRVIYGDPGPILPVTEQPVSLGDALPRALEAGSERIGISARADGATLWYVAKGQKQRRVLLDGWQTIFEDMLDPSPFEAEERAKDAPESFDGTLNTGRSDLAVHVQVVAGRGGTEFLLRPLRVPAAARAASLVLPPAVAAELRLLARGRNARVGVFSREPRLARDVLPHLPALVFQQSVRAAHITTEDDDYGVYTIRPHGDSDMADAVAALDFDAITVDLPPDPGVAVLMRSTPISFAHLENPDDAELLRNTGVNWVLTVSRSQEAVSWDLRATHR